MCCCPLQAFFTLGRDIMSRLNRKMVSSRTWWIVNNPVTLWLCCDTVPGDRLSSHQLSTRFKSSGSCLQALPVSCLKLIGPSDLCFLVERQQSIRRRRSRQDHRVTIQEELLQVLAAVGGTSTLTCSSGCRRPTGAQLEEGDTPEKFLHQLPPPSQLPAPPQALPPSVWTQQESRSTFKYWWWWW